MVRWDQLFADLEGELAAARDADVRAEVAERTRIERGRLRLVDRLRPAVGGDIVVAVAGAGTVRGLLIDVGSDWLLLVVSGPPGDVLVALDAVSWISGLGPVSSEPGSEGRVAARLDLRSGLRGIARDRAAVRVVLRDGSELTGTVDRVGADHVELAVHSGDEPRRASAVRSLLTVPVVALALVRPA